MSAEACPSSRQSLPTTDGCTQKKPAKVSDASIFCGQFICSECSVLVQCADVVFSLTVQNAVYEYSVNAVSRLSVQSTVWIAVYDVYQIL